jgi:hypothetical protein
LENPVEGLEHIIPECIGGKLQSNILCKSCNNKLGSEVISKIKIDPTFRLAVESLKTQLPKLSNQFLEKATYIGYSPDGSTVKLTKKGKQLIILRHNNKLRGVLELDTEYTGNFLRKHLQRALLPEDEISKIIESFKDLDNLEPLIIPTGEKLQKNLINKIQPELKTEFVDPRFWVIMAYEYLSLMIGNNIYQPYFGQFREYILTGKNKPALEIGFFQGSKDYRTHHFLGVEPKEDCINVYIQLFGFIYQRITFLKITGNVKDIVYFEDLEKNISMIAFNREDAKNGVWHEFK